MIIHTIVPEYLIFQEQPELLNNLKVLNLNGVEMEVDIRNDGSLQLIRLLSTNPQDYLKYSPGQVLPPIGSL
ncbi:MAG: hypothetical protein K0S51_716 [Bacillales bacterium]|jgi:hypothetical protein|nr:hypothetical protein [Bacillales bacterium]